MSEMSEERLREIRARCEAAKPGLRCCSGCNGMGTRWRTVVDDTVVDDEEHWEWQQVSCDACGPVVRDLRDLLAEVERLHCCLRQHRARLAMTTLFTMQDQDGTRYEVERVTLVDSPPAWIVGADWPEGVSGSLNSAGEWRWDPAEAQLFPDQDAAFAALEAAREREEER